MEQQSQQHPLQQLQQAVCSVSSQVARNLAGAQQHWQQQLAPLQGRVSRGLAAMGVQIPQQQQQRRAFPSVRRAHEQQLHGCWQPMIAVSDSSGRVTALRQR